MSEAYKRAEMPSGAQAVLDERTLAASNANLLQVLSDGQHVLDVGCGSGAITQGMAALVGPTGSVRGVDRSRELIDEARQRYGGVAGLSFDCADVLTLALAPAYDVVTAARTLQWVAQPEHFLRHLMTLARPGGLVCILDYNHTLIEWTPEPPPSMRHFYDAFLRWRADAGMDNAIGDHVEGMMQHEGLQIVLNEDRSESASRGMFNFSSHISLWSKVAETRGKQMVADGYVGESFRLRTISEYNAWCASDAQSMRLHLRAVHGQLLKKPST